MLNKISTIKCLALFFIFFFVGCGQNEKQKVSFIKPKCLTSQSACIIKSTYGDFSVLFNVDSVITENEFDIVLISHSHHQIKSISAHIEGKNMFMGKIPLFFEPYQYEQTTQLIARTMLGSCSEENMRWVILFTVDKIKKNGEVVNEQFSVEFDSERA